MTHIMRSSLFVAVFVLCSVPSWSAEADNPLLGCWVVQRVGSRDVEKLPFLVEWEFTKDEVIVRDLTNLQEVSRNSYTIDLSKNPKWITVTVVDRVTEVRQGIFRIAGNELHLKQTVGEGARPADFLKDDYVILKRQQAR